LGSDTAGLGIVGRFGGAIMPDQPVKCKRLALVGYVRARRSMSRSDVFWMRTMTQPAGHPGGLF
jgi:hypothetical protein